MGNVSPELEPTLTLVEAERLVKPLARELRLLLPSNRETTLRIFYDAAKLIYYKQKQLRKPQLKQKEIAQALELVYFHHRHDSRISVEGALAENFGAVFSESAALDYYEKKVEGIAVDTLGNAVTIDDLGIDFLYEEHEKSGRYLEPRGKRLPWIKHTLATTREVYEGIEYSHEQYYYVSHYVIPLKVPTSVEIDSYFVVIVRKRKDKSRGFLTAFPVDRYNQLLGKISRWRPVF